MFFSTKFNVRDIMSALFPIAGLPAIHISFPLFLSICFTNSSKPLLNEDLEVLVDTFIGIWINGSKLKCRCLNMSDIIKRSKFFSLTLKINFNYADRLCTPYLTLHCQKDTWQTWCMRRTEIALSESRRQTCLDYAERIAIR